MAQAGLTDEACQQAADAMARFGSQRAAAESLGMSRSTFQHRINEAERRGFCARSVAAGVDRPRHTLHHFHISHGRGPLEEEQFAVMENHI